VHFYRIKMQQNLQKTKIVVLQAVQTFCNLYTPVAMVTTAGTFQVTSYPENRMLNEHAYVRFDSMRL
jgi:hypothetical protein